MNLAEREQRFWRLKDSRGKGYKQRSCFGTDEGTEQDWYSGVRTTDCRYLVAYLSWWCTNKKAIKYRGTRIPDCYACTCHQYRGRSRGEIRRADQIRAARKLYKKILRWTRKQWIRLTA